MEPEKQGQKTDWYRPALVFYGKTTSWILGPLVIVYLVKHFTNTSQTVFFILLALGFILTIYGIYKEVQFYKKSLEKKEGEK